MAQKFFDERISSSKRSYRLLLKVGRGRGTWRLRDVRNLGRGDAGTWGIGDVGTRGRADVVRQDFGTRRRAGI